MFRSLLLMCVSTSVFLAATPATQTLGRPLVFEPNRGQAPAEVQWLARGAGLSTRLHGRRRNTCVARSRRSGAAVTRNRRGRDFLIRRFVKTASEARVRPLSSCACSAAARGTPRASSPPAAPAIILLGDQPEEWRTDIPHYARVKAAGVYEGIDVVFYGREGVLEYDFVVAPGADPRQIQLEFDGAAKVQLDAKSGDLLLTTSSEREVRMGKPKVYQEMGGRKLDVKSSYQILDNGRAAFTLADYDRRLPLVIDPTVMFTKFLGGSNTDQANRSLSIVWETRT